MRLQQLVLHNFRPFYGHQTIDLSTKRNKPLILVEALNDVGKTSMFKAIQFCLYGTEFREKVERHINRTAQKEGEGQMYVGLNFYHEDKHYQVIRSVDFSKTSDGELLTGKEELDIRVDGVPQDLETTTEQNRFVEAILPKDASQFFLFDGEDIQKYTKHPPGKNVKEAIEMVLGIRELLNARDDLEKIERDLSRELDKLLKSRSKEQKEAEKVELLGKEVETLREQVKTLEAKIKNARETVEECDKTLRKNKQIKGKINRRKEAEQRCEQLNEQIKTNKNQLRDFNRHLGVLFVAPLLKELSKIRKTSVPHWRRVAVSALLHGPYDKCICGRPLNPEVRELLGKLLDKELEKAPTQYLGEKADELITEYSPSHLEKEFYSLIMSLRDLEASLDTEKKTIDRLNEEVGGREDLSVNVKTAEKTRSRAAKDLKSYEQEKNKKEIRLSIKQREYRKKQTKLALEQTDRDVRDKQEHLHACQKCKEALEEAVSELVDSRKTNVEKLASKVFLELTNAPDLYKGIEITDEYELKIKTVGGTTRPVWIQAPSAGQSQVIAMSFIAALNQYTARDAPVVIDTPIGRLDPIHKENVIDFYPSIGPQTLILYQPRELSDEDIRPIGKYISSEWLLKRDSTNPDATIIIRKD